MNKSKSTFFCQNCGAESVKWVGKCPSCGQWNTYIEEIVSKKKNNTLDFFDRKHNHFINLNDTKLYVNHHRYSSEILEFDRVLGGGIVPGSLVLIGGDPGIGKSTLVLQMALKQKKKTLYVSGEESIEQIKMRSHRIGHSTDQCFVLSETDLTGVVQQINELVPEIVIIDSIQTLHSDRIESAMGSISQVKECAGVLMKYAKQKQISVFLVGHVNKEGVIAGPKVLEHMVDTVLQFEGDQHLAYRILRTTKNRFGSTSELGVFEMSTFGLKEVPNPSEVFLSSRENMLSGSACGTTLEGNRTIIIETQALVTASGFGTPQRSSTGYDHKRLNMLLAVMEKRLGIKLSSQDAFLNIVGGIKVQDTALDLAICVAIFSSFDDTALSSDRCFSAEIGLGGELRPVHRMTQRINEAEKLGFKKFYLSQHNMKGLESNTYKIEICSYGKLSELLRDIF